AFRRTECPAVVRVGYEEEDVRRALTAPGLDGLPTHERFVLAQVIGKGGLLRTASPRLLRTPGLPVEPIVREAARSPVEEPRGTRAVPRDASRPDPGPPGGRTGGRAGVRRRPAAPRLRMLLGPDPKDRP
ncbi:DUF6190 family protein, partial [Streptomyces wedmorensis]